MTKNARAEGVVKEAIKRGRVVKEVMRERHFDDSGTLDCRGVELQGVLIYTLLRSRML